MWHETFDVQTRNLLIENVNSCFKRSLHNSITSIEMKLYVYTLQARFMMYIAWR